MTVSGTIKAIDSRLCVTRSGCKRGFHGDASITQFGPQWTTSEIPAPVAVSCLSLHSYIGIIEGMKPSLFRSSSVFWRVNREITTGLAGPRAVLMQIAHPLVAAGVADHSRYRDARFGRLYRTALAAASITF